jgi:hypothetical protein
LIIQLVCFEEELFLFFLFYKLPKDIRYKGLTEIDLLALEKSFENFYSIFILLPLSPLEKGCFPLFGQISTHPTPQG